MKGKGTGNWVLIFGVTLFIVAATFILSIVITNQVIKNYDTLLCQNPVLDTNGHCTSTGSCSANYVCENPSTLMPTTCESRPLPNNTTCSDACVVPTTGKCHNGDCVGTCGGYCSSFLDFGSELCPNLTFVPSVEAEVYENSLLFYGQLCFFGKCVWTLEWPIVGQFACEDNVDAIYYNNAASTQALEFISGDIKNCLKANVLCSDGTPLILYEYKCSEYQTTLPSNTSITSISEEHSTQLKDTMLMVKNRRKQAKSWFRGGKIKRGEKAKRALKPMGMRSGPIKGGSFSSLNALLFDETYQLPETIQKRDTQGTQWERRKKKPARIQIQQEKNDTTEPETTLQKNDITENATSLSEVNEYVRETLGGSSLADYIRIAFCLWQD